MRSGSIIRVLIFVLLLVSIPAAVAQVSIGISVRIGPPPLPVYVQPVCPAPGYVWIPGYWAWSERDGDHYWVPGTWELAPVGMLWTPGYWGYERGVYLWHGGYWGPHVGYYGGINYGYGYTGSGYYGGRWNHGHFYYNQSVNNVNVHVRNINVYNERVIVHNSSHVSYNGPGGIAARPTTYEMKYQNERHTQPLPSQLQHESYARGSSQSFVRTNHGAPTIAATARPGEYKGPGVTRATTGTQPMHNYSNVPRPGSTVQPDNRSFGNHTTAGGYCPSTTNTNTRNTGGYNPSNSNTRNTGSYTPSTSNAGNTHTLNNDIGDGRHTVGNTSTRNTGGYNPSNATTGNTHITNSNTRNTGSYNPSTANTGTRNTGNFNPNTRTMNTTNTGGGSHGGGNTQTFNRPASNTSAQPKTNNVPNRGNNKPPNR